MTTIGVGGVVLILLLLLFGAVFLISSGIIFLVWNGLAGFFHGPTITFPIAMLMDLALGVIGSGLRGSR